MRFYIGGAGGQGNYMNESVADAIDSIPGVVAVVPILSVGEGVTPHTVTTPFGQTVTFNVSAYTIEGVPLNSSLIADNYVPLPANITEGRNLQTNDTGVVVLSLNNTGYFGVGIGGEVNINGTNFKVVGVHGESGSSVYALGQASDVTTLYMNITDAQRVSGLTGEISKLDVYAENSSATLLNTVATEISSIPGITATTELSILQNFQSVYNTTLAADESAISQTQTVAFQEIAVSVAATSLIVLFVMLYTVRERTKEIGTLKAIGFSNWNVMSQFILEGVLLSLAAGIVGIGIGSVAAPPLSGFLLPHMSSLLGNTFSRSSGPIFISPSGAGGSGPVIRAGGASGVGSVTAVLSPELMLLVLGGAIVLGALGSLYPAWRASRTRPAEAMRYE